MPGIVQKCCRGAKMNKSLSLPSRCYLLKEEIDTLNYPLPCPSSKNGVKSHLLYLCKSTYCVQGTGNTAVILAPCLPSRALRLAEPSPTGSNHSFLDVHSIFPGPFCTSLNSTLDSSIWGKGDPSPFSRLLFSTLIEHRLWAGA